MRQIAAASAVLALAGCELVFRPAGGAPDAAPSDGAPDGDPNLDSDGDGIVDAVDNCPSMPNTDQFDEDGDSWGDACDNCPGSPQQQQTNTDGDELGDACDPFCDAIDDRWKFEGFGIDDISTWTQSGTWSWHPSGAQRGEATATLIHPDPGNRYGSVYTRLVFDGNAPGTGAASGLRFRHDPNDGSAITCHVEFDPDDNARLILVLPGVIVAVGISFPPTASQAYVLALAVRHTTTVEAECAAFDDNGTELDRIQAVGVRPTGTGDRVGVYSVFHSTIFEYLDIGRRPAGEQPCMSLAGSITRPGSPAGP